MRPIAVAPSLACKAALPAADFVDAFAIDIVDAAVDAPEAARRAFSRQPQWTTWLLALRNRLVTPFGLKPGADASVPGHQRLGIFPVVSSTPQRVVLGFDDKHLDFRIVIDVLTLDAASRRVTATTLVKRNNLFGHVYLATVMPFHKLIVPATLARVAL
jgi:Protein of unknown function (DUF2867)